MTMSQSKQSQGVRAMPLSSPLQGRPRAQDPSLSPSRPGIPTCSLALGELQQGKEAALGPVILREGESRASCCCRTSVAKEGRPSRGEAAESSSLTTGGPGKGVAGQEAWSSEPLPQALTTGRP